jgi:RimJ/RimL family protein N-acetyltransferase
MIIETTLRQITPDDHKFLVDLHNDPIVLRNLTHPNPISIKQHVEWWNRISHDPQQLRLIFMVNDQRVGLAKFYDIDKDNQSCALGGDIHVTHRGCGYAKHMWNLMLKVCFDDLKLHRVWLTTASFNMIAIHVYHSLGFKDEGIQVQSLYRDGKFHDQICMYMLREQWKKS